MTVSVSWGLGHHIDVLSSHPEQITYTVKWMFLSEIFAIMSPGFGRISFAFLLLGLLPPKGPRSVRPKILWSIIAIQFVVDLATVIISTVQCRPIEGFWNKNIQANCWDPRVQQYAGFLQGCKLSPKLFLAKSTLALLILPSRKLHRGPSAGSVSDQSVLERKHGIETESGLERRDGIGNLVGPY